MIPRFFFLQKKKLKKKKKNHDLFSSFEKIKGMILNYITCQYFRSYSVCVNYSQSSENGLNCMLTGQESLFTRNCMNSNFVKTYTLSNRFF